MADKAQTKKKGAMVINGSLTRGFTEHFKEVTIRTCGGTITVDMARFLRIVCKICNESQNMTPEIDLKTIPAFSRYVLLYHIVLNEYGGRKKVTEAKFNEMSRFFQVHGSLAPTLAATTKIVDDKLDELIQEKSFKHSKTAKNGDSLAEHNMELAAKIRNKIKEPGSNDLFIFKISRADIHSVHTKYNKAVDVEYSGEESSANGSSSHVINVVPLLLLTSYKFGNPHNICSNKDENTKAEIWSNNVILCFLKGQHPESEKVKEAISFIERFPSFEDRCSAYLEKHLNISKARTKNIVAYVDKILQKASEHGTHELPFCLDIADVGTPDGKQYSYSRSNNKIGNRMISKNDEDYTTKMNELYDRIAEGENARKQTTVFGNPFRFQNSDSTAMPIYIVELYDDNNKPSFLGKTKKRKNVNNRAPASNSKKKAKGEKSLDLSDLEMSMCQQQDAEDDLETFVSKHLLGGKKPS
jgi:hypothetical protein